MITLHQASLNWNFAVFLSIEITQNHKSFVAVNGKYCKILDTAVLVFVFADIQEGVT